MVDLYVNRHICQLFGLNFLWDLNISCELDPQIHGEKDSLPPIFPKNAPHWRVVTM